jgi:hypothetical protein
MPVWMEGISVDGTGWTMKQLFEVRFGNYSCYVLADDDEQANNNVDGMLEAMYNGEGVWTTGSTLNKPVDATDEAVAKMLNESKLTH